MLTSFAHVEQPSQHPGVVRAELVAKSIQNAVHNFDALCIERGANSIGSLEITIRPSKFPFSQLPFNFSVGDFCVGRTNPEIAQRQIAQRKPENVIHREDAIQDIIHAQCLGIRSVYKTFKRGERRWRVQVFAYRFVEFTQSTCYD